MSTAAEARERYHWYKARHICVRCHRREALGDYVMCDVCRDEKIERDRAYRESNREDLNAKWKEHYARMIAEGRCTVCGKPVKSGGVRCARCAAKHRLRQRTRYAEREVSIYGTVDV